MKSNLKNKSIRYMFILLLTVASCGQHGERAEHEHADTYTCPMHPTVISDKPGICPVCGMNLVRKSRPEEEFEITKDLSTRIKSPSGSVVSSIKMVKGEFKSVPISVEVNGLVTYDTKSLYSVSARVGGRLEKVYLKYTFQSVSKGQKIAEIYSPELTAAHRELIFLLQNDAENATLIEAAKNKLGLLGLTQSQINNLIERKEASNTFSVYSPYSGYLIASQQAPSSSKSMPAAPTRESMSSTQSSYSTPIAPVTEGNNFSGSIAREGSYISPGQALIDVVGREGLRIEFDLPSASGFPIQRGDKIVMDFGDGKTQKAAVDFIQPFFTQGQDFVKLRVYTKEINRLQIGQLVSAKILLSPIEALWIPREAVINLGADRIVFVKEKGILKPRKVKTGISIDGVIEIKNGLTTSEEIAANAQYLVDSESFIKAK